MVKKLTGVAFFLVLISATARAETIHLKDGRVVIGKILQRSAYYILVEGKRGVPDRYYRDQIDFIEEDVPEEDLITASLYFDDIPDDKVKLIVKLFIVMGLKDNIEASWKTLLAKAPAERREELKNLLDIEKFLEKIVPIYDKYYDKEDLQVIVDFYSSPAGKKFLKASPNVMREVIQASIDYFKSGQ